MNKRSKSKTRGTARGKRPNVELEEGLPFTVSFFEGAASKEKMVRWREEMLNWLHDQHETLESLLLQHDPFDMLGNLIMVEIAHNPETYKETEHEGLAAAVEYIALIYMGHPHGTDSRDLPLGLHGEAVLEAAARAKRILHGISTYYASEGALVEDREGEKNLDYFRFKTISHEMFVRNPSYPHHQRHHLEQLFAPLQEWLTAHVGFSVADVLRVEDAVKDIWAVHGRERAEAEKQGRKELLRLSEEARKGKTGGNHDSPPIRHLASLSRKLAAAMINRMSTAWLMSYIGSTTFAFTNSELAEATGLPPERVAAVTDFFSVDLGTGAQGFNMFSPTHELRSRPFLRHQADMLYVAPGTLLWAIQPRLEEAIQGASKADKTQKNAWAGYQKSRGDYLERETLALFKNTLKQAVVHQSLSYTTTDDKGKDLTTELDGLVAYDTTLFLIEAKAGNYVPAARRGAKDSIKTVIKKLIGEAHAQAIRAKEYINASDECEFTLQDKTTIKLAGRAFSRIIPVVVTLESLDIFNAALHEVAKTDLLPAGELPWVVSLDILRVISEVNEFPTQLIHYLNRRLRLNDFKKFHAHDELDWFGLYLNSGLYYEQNEEIEQVGWVSVTSQTDQFDAFYAHKLGIRRKKAPQPRQRMPHLFRQLILELDALPNPGHSEVILSLLEWSSDARKSFIINFESIRRRTRKDGQVHDFTLGAKKGGGLTCMADYSKNYEKRMETLFYMVTLRKYKQQADNWLGLLTLVDHPKLVHGFFVSNHAWQHEPQLEQLARDEMQPLKALPFLNDSNLKNLKD
jgi:hypothetical protein